MPQYTKTGPFVSGGAPGIDSGFLNNVETALSAVQYGVNFITPYSLISNGSLTSGSASTLTCTGVGGVPSGAVAVLINAFFISSAVAGFASFTPHGTAWSNGNYPILIAYDATHNTAGSFLVPLDATGKMDLKANSANLSNLFVQMYAYVY